MKSQSVQLPGLLFVVLAVFFLTDSEMVAQTQKQYIKAADQAFAEHNYREAMIYYDTVYSIRPDDSEIAWKFAEAARLYKVYALAAPAYKNVAANQRGRKEHPLALYWLGVVQKSQGNYAAAIEAFATFADSLSTGLEYYRTRALEEVENCRWAMEISEADFPDRVITHLDTFVNTVYSEIAPFWTGEELFYSSLRFPNTEDTYIPPRPITKILKYDSVSPGQPLGDTINFRSRHSANLTINRAGTRLYFTGCDYSEGLRIRCMIYQRDKQENGSWGPPIRLGGEVNVEGATSSNPAVGYDESIESDVLYFSSDRPGGKGGMDIWYVPVAHDGTPSSPVNFEKINTGEDEITPFYDETFRVLYFSSQAHQNMGGFDIFELKKTGPNSWGEIINVGLPVNTSYDETHFTVDNTGDFAHYASNHPDQVVHNPSDREIRTCCSDIYSASLNRFVGLEATAVCDGKPIGEAKFYLRQLDGRVAPVEILADTFRQRLLPEAEFQLVVSIPDYHPDTIDFTTQNRQGGEVISLAAQPKARTFLNINLNDKINEEPIVGASVKVLGEDGKQWFSEESTPGSSIRIEVEPPQTYTIIVKAPGFLGNSREVTVGESCEPQHLQEYFPMTPLKLELPLRLYFDNDRPDPGTLRTTTKASYDKVYQSYYKKKREFQQAFTKGMQSDSLAEIAALQIDSFFEMEVRNGFERLEAFADELIPYLEKLEDDQTLIISIRGFASPVADGIYNQNLTKRRIASLRNYFNRKYGGDRLQEFIENKKLLVIEKSFGESEASEDVSDDPDDDRNAVYSVKASRERRVEIIDIARIEEE